MINRGEVSFQIVMGPANPGPVRTGSPAELTTDATGLGRALLLEAALPAKAAADALHIALAATHGMNCLVTWNCTHIANATMRPKIEAICRANGFEPPVICTPLELLEE